MKLPPLLASLAVAAAGLLTLPAQAVSPTADAHPAFQTPVALETLAGLRGGTAVANDMDLNGVTSGNSAYRVQTGSNTIDAGAFANMSGIPVVIQNSGANVLIQNATIVNLQMN